MIHIQSTNGTEWFQILTPVELTEEQQSILDTQQDEEAILEIVELQRNSSRKLLRDFQFKHERELYEIHKPIIKENEVFELLAVDIVKVKGSPMSGIINYRLNGEHKQIRF